MNMWVVRAGDKGQHEHKALTEGTVAIGYMQMPDPVGFEDRDSMRQWYLQQYPDLKSGAVSKEVSQIWDFVHNIAQGDVVILPCKSKPIVWIGQFSGDSQFVETAEVKHVRPAKWLTSIPRSEFDSELIKSLNRPQAVFELTSDKEHDIREILNRQESLAQFRKELVLAYAKVVKKVANNTVTCPNIKFEHEMESKEALKKRFKEFLQEPTQEKFQSFWNRNYIWAATMGGNATNLIKKHNGLDPITEVLKQIDVATEYNSDWEQQLGASGALAEFWGKLKDQPIRNACADHALVFFGLEKPRSYSDFLEEFKQFEGFYQSSLGQNKVTPYPIEIELDQLFNFVDKATDTDLVENPDIDAEDIKALYAIKKEIDDITRPPSAAPVYWVEKRNVKEHAGRESSEYPLGEALRASQTSKPDPRGGVKDVHRSMREVKPGDIVLHLTDNEAFSGVSVAASAVDDSVICPADEERPARPGYLVLLKDYVPLDSTIHKSELFEDSGVLERLSQVYLQYRKRKDYPGGLFFDIKNRKIGQGGYLTRAPPEVVDILNDIYKQKTDSDLPHFRPLEAQSWIFQAVPKRFNLLERLPQLGELPWTANQRRDQMRVGDKVYYWKAGKDAGIYGIGTLVSPPQQGLDAEFGDWGVLTKIERFLGSQYIPKQVFLENPVLQDCTIVRSAQGTNFLLSNKQASELEKLIPSPSPLGVPTDRQYWVEITEIENKQRPDRINGEYACGKALWSPQTNESGSRIYSNMERIKPGDIVFHLTDSRGFTGVSIADSEVDREWTDVPPNTRWSNRDAYFLVKLKCYEKLTPPLERTEIFDNGEVWQQLLSISTEFNQKRSGSSDRLGRFLFFNRDQRLQEGSYLSEAPPELVQLLNQVYEKKTGHGLPYIFDTLPVDCGQISPDILEIQPKYSIEDFIEDSGFGRDQIEVWEKRLRTKKHIVFQGPPGTGKTFVAEKLAQIIVSETNGFYQTVQFHPSYSYEDFMLGIRPEVTDGFLTYEVKRGIFLEFCEEASKRDDNTLCIMIIDEMNRAKLSRVFGELMYLLEYRGQSIPLAYHEEGRPTFTIPPNVRIIGTMNTADRSIALVDHALRRRFSFIFLGPDYKVLRDFLVKHNLPSKQLPDILEKMNKGLIRDRHYQLGISFFMREDLKETMRDVWEGEIEPYLDEYLYGKDIKIDPYRWVNLIKNQLSEWSD